jgi:hypothetical protein
MMIYKKIIIGIMGISHLIFTTDYSMNSSVNNISKRFNYLHARVYVHHRKTPMPSVNPDSEMRCHILRCSKLPTGMMYSSIPWPISTPMIANTKYYSHQTTTCQCLCQSHWYGSSMSTYYHLLQYTLITIN